MLDCWVVMVILFFFQAEDGIRDAQESRGLGDVYKRQHQYSFLPRFFTHNYKYLGILINLSFISLIGKFNTNYSNSPEIPG